MTILSSSHGISRPISSLSGRPALAVAIFLFLCSFALYAQVTSTIQGHLSDTSGGSVPKALVKVTNVNTGVSRTAYSAEDGYYRIPDLLAGSYEVRVEMVGFKTIVRSGIEVNAQTTTNLNFTLEVGEVTQTVDVTGEEPRWKPTRPGFPKCSRSMNCALCPPPAGGS